MQELTNGKLQDVFRAVLSLPDGADVTAVTQEGEPAWDSLAHALLVAAVESEFAVQIDAADSLALTSYQAVARYLAARGA